MSRIYSWSKKQLLLTEENHALIRHSGGDRWSVETIWPIGMRTTEDEMQVVTWPLTEGRSANKDTKSESGQLVFGG